MPRSMRRTAIRKLAAMMAEGRTLLHRILLGGSEHERIPRGVPDLGATDLLGDALHFRVVGEDDREPEQPRCALRRGWRVERLPRVAAEMVVVAAGAEERRLIAGLRGHV